MAVPVRGYVREPRLPDDRWGNPGVLAPADLGGARPCRRVVAFGDFNDDPFDESICVHAGATRERSDVVNARSAALFYNLAWNYLRQEVTNRAGEARTLHGSLYFRGDGNVFDQILVARGLLLADSPLRVHEETAQIEAFPEMVDRGVAPEPIRFGLPRGDAARNVNQDGFSDHYPVSVAIEER